MNAPFTAITRAAVLAAGLVAQAAAEGATPESGLKVKDANESVIEASTRIFACLSAGKKNSASGAQLDGAMGHLRDARNKYLDLQRERGEKAFNPEGPNKDLALKLIADFQGDKDKNLNGSFKTEGEVAELNKRAVEGLMKVIESWKGSCTVPFRDKRQYIEFIGAKVRVERASQLAEIAFSPAPK